MPDTPLLICTGSVVGSVIPSQVAVANEVVSVISVSDPSKVPVAGAT